MKKTMNGKVYDLDSAELIHEYETEADGGSYVFGELYRLADGTYVARTWGTIPGQSEVWHAGTKDDAMVWSFTSMRDDAFEKNFGISKDAYADKVGYTHIAYAGWEH